MGYRSRNTALPLRHGFTLIELVVVVLILGIIVAVAAPRFFKSTDDARESALRHDLAVVRDAIMHYRAETDNFPGESGTEADFKADMKRFLITFPRNPLGNSDTVGVSTSGNPLSFAGGSAGWLYDNRTGEFIANSNGSGPSGIAYDEL